MKLLEGKTALVTGATRGIGRAIAVKFAEAGANVAFTYRQINSNAEELIKEIEAMGVKCKGYAADAADFAMTDTVVKDIVADFGRIDVLVNNAGITKDGLILRMTEEQWDAVITTNLKSAFNFTRAVVPFMAKQRGGSIINMSSVVGENGNAGQCNYSASKAGLIGLAKSIAKEMGPRGIRANCIAPGFIVGKDNSFAPCRQPRGRCQRGTVPCQRHVGIRKRPGNQLLRCNELLMTHPIHDMKQDNNKEIFPVVDEQGNTIGSATRGECHNGSKLLHPVVHLHLFDPNGRIYLQQRPIWKDIQPGKWDTAVGGHVDYGEEIETALQREVYEELGLTGLQARFLTRYVFESEREKELVHVYSAIHDGEVHPSDELDGGRFWSAQEISDAMGAGILTPNFEQEYIRIQPLL